MRNTKMFAAALGLTISQMGSAHAEVKDFYDEG